MEVSRKLLERLIVPLECVYTHNTMTLMFFVGAGGVGHVVGNKLPEGRVEPWKWRLQNIHREGNHEASEDTALGMHLRISRVYPNYVEIEWKWYKSYRR